MQRPDGFLSNTDTPTGRTFGAAKNNPGDNSGTGMDKDIYNDPFYGEAALIDSYKEGGISNTPETLTDSDMRDAIEELTEKTVNGVSGWDGTTIFGIGDLASYKGYQFVSFKAGNQNNIPIDTIATQWMKCPKSDVLLDQFASGEVISGGLSSIADRAGSDYQQNILFGKYRLGGKGDAFYNFYRIALDGTQVTGDATLEAILKPGLAGEYWNIDMIAPDVLGTRTLIDMGDYVPTPQSSGGDADTLGELVEDRFQGHWHIENVGANVSPANSNFATDFRNGQDVSGQGLGRANTENQKSDSIGPPITDVVNGTPRTGSTTHGKRFTEGASYIIVMVAA